MKPFVLAVALLLPSFGFASNLVFLQCRTGGNNAYAMTWDADNQSLRIWMFNSVDYGTYPQVDSGDPSTVAFAKTPLNINNGIPMRFEVPASVRSSAIGSEHTVEARVSQNWPGPIDENVFHTYVLKCNRVRNFVF